MMEPTLDPQSCEHCGQLVKLYRRQIHSLAAESLIRLHRKTIAHPGLEFFHIGEFFKSTTKGMGGDFAKLRYWGLIEMLASNPDEDKRTSGYWKITVKGRQFVKGKISIPKSVFLYNQTFYGFEGPEIFISDCFEEPFSYRELMGGEQMEFRI